MERGHQEKSAALAGAFSGEFEPTDLEDDADGFGDEDSAAEDEEEFLADDDGDIAEEAAEGEGAGVSHEDGGGVAVEPEEAHTGTRHRAGEDRHLPGGFDDGDQQIGSDFAFADDQSEDQENASQPCKGGEIKRRFERASLIAGIRSVIMRDFVT